MSSLSQRNTTIWVLLLGLLLAGSVGLLIGWGGSLFGVLAGGGLMLLTLTWFAIRRRTLFPYLIVTLVALDNVVVFETGPFANITKPALVVVVLMYILVEIFGRRARLTFPNSVLLTPAVVMLLYFTLTMFWTSNTVLAISQIAGFIQLFILMWLCGHFTRQIADLQHFVRAWILYSLVLTAILLVTFQTTSSTDIGTVRTLALNQNPNAIAAYIAISLGALMGLWLRENGTGYPLRHFVLFAAIFSSLVLGLVLTGSRGGIITFGVLFVIVAVMSGRRNARRSLGLLLVVALGAVILFQFFPSIVENFRVRLEYASYDPTGDRATLAITAWQIFLKHPIGGAGLASFRDYNEIIAGDLQVAHNTYLTALSEGGILGLAVLSAFVGTAVWAAIQAIRQSSQTHRNPLTPLTWATLFMLLGILFAGLSINTWTLKPFWLILGVTQAAYRLGMAENQSLGDTKRVVGSRIHHPAPATSAQLLIAKKD